MRYDACVIGASADGLAAAATLARAGLKTVVVERNARAGGRLETREFHPGFRASPFCDEIPPIPEQLFWSLDLARRGAIFLPAHEAPAPPQERLHAHATRLRRDALARAQAATVPPARRGFFSRRRPASPAWPGEEWSEVSLAALLAERIGDEAQAVELTAMALAGRAADPALGGSALHLLSPGCGGSGAVIGGLGALAAALEAAARDAGAEIRLGVEAGELRRRDGRLAGAGLSDGTELMARAVISTLDLKRTVLSLFQWSDLPPPVVKQAAGLRMGGGAARVLLALDERPALDPQRARSAMMAGWEPETHAASLAACRAGLIPEAPPAFMRLVSAADPRLAPEGQATFTLTLGCVPFRLFDGAWTKEKRDVLRGRALAAAERVLPGIADHVLAADVIAPPDIEEALGATDGDLDGGEIAPDQMFAMRPFSDADAPASPRTPLEGLYLAGPSSAAGPLGTCASGALAAAALLADLRDGRLK